MNFHPILVKLNTMKCKILLISLIPWIFFSCYKDKGNYDYNELSEIEITGISPIYHRHLGDTISIFPEISINGQKVNSADYEYEWHIWTGKSPGKKISDLKVWDKHELSGIKNATYNARYLVREKASGLISFKDFELILAYDLAEGLLVMCDVDGMMRLDMVSYFDSSFFFKKDVLKATGSTLPPQKNPYQVVTFPDNPSPGKNALYLLTESGTNRVHYDDFSYKENYSFNMHGIGFPQNFRPERMTPDPAMRCLMYGENNAYIYFPVINMYWVYYNQFNKNMPFNDIFKINKYSVEYQNRCIVYDDDSKSFKMQMGGMLAANDIYSPEIHFKFRNTGMDLFYMSLVIMGGEGLFYAVLQSPDGKRFLATCSMNGTQTSYVDLNKNDTPHARKAPIYAFPPKYTAFFYYLSEDKKDIYCFHLLTETSEKVYSSANSNEEISLLTFLGKDIFGKDKPSQNNLVVGFYDPSAPMEEAGRVEVLQFDSFGKLKIQTTKKGELSWKGFGKPVSYTYKYTAKVD